MNPQFPLTDWAGNLLSPCKKYNTALAVFRSVCYTYHDFRGESQKAVARQSGATLLATRAAAFAFSLPLPDLLQCCPLFFKEYSTFAGQNTLSAPTQLSGDRTPRLTRRNTPSIRQNSPSFSAPFWLGTNIILSCWHSLSPLSALSITLSPPNSSTIIYVVYYTLPVSAGAAASS